MFNQWETSHQIHDMDLCGLIGQINLSKTPRIKTSIFSSFCKTNDNGNMAFTCLR